MPFDLQYFTSSFCWFQILISIWFISGVISKNFSNSYNYYIPKLETPILLVKPYFFISIRDFQVSMIFPRHIMVSVSNRVDQLTLPRHEKLRWTWTMNYLSIFCIILRTGRLRRFCGKIGTTHSCFMTSASPSGMGTLL